MALSPVITMAPINLPPILVMVLLLVPMKPLVAPVNIGSSSATVGAGSTISVVVDHQPVPAASKKILMAGNDPAKLNVNFNAVDIETRQNYVWNCGATARREVSAILVEGLKRLEYRGYGSAGVAIIDNTGNIGCQKNG